MMLQCAICDDEPCMLNQIDEQLIKYMDTVGTPYQITLFSSGLALLKDPLAFDLLLLDIQMEDMDGIETAKQLRHKGFKGIIIFITVLKEHVFDSFLVEAYDYLLKPLKEDRFIGTMKRALDKISSNVLKNIVVRKGNTIQVIPLNEIVFCEVSGRKVYLYTKQKQVIDYYYRLEDLEREIDKRFFKCHRSYLINLDYVQGMDAGVVKLYGEHTVSVSRLRETAPTQALLLHMKERRR